MQYSDIINLFALGTSLCALFTSLFVAYRQIQLTKHSNSFPITIEMFKEFRSSEFKAHLKCIFQEVPNLNEEKTSIYKLPVEIRNSALNVSHYFDNIGLMVANNAIDKRLVISFLGGTAFKTWEVLSPFIMAEREERHNGLYQEFFENLIYEIRRNPPEKVFKKLSLKRLNA